MVIGLKWLNNYNNRLEQLSVQKNVRHITEQFILLIILFQLFLIMKNYYQINQLKNGIKVNYYNKKRKNEDRVKLKLLLLLQLMNRKRLLKPIQLMKFQLLNLQFI